MSPYPVPSYLDYFGDGVGSFDFMPLENETLAVRLGAEDLPLFYAHLDPIQRLLIFANARRQPALLVRQNSARVFHLEKEGAMRIEPGDVLSAFNGAIVEEAVVRVIRESPGDRANRLVGRILDSARGTAVAVRFITSEEPALAEEAEALELAVA